MIDPRPAPRLQALAVLLASAMVAVLCLSLAAFWRQQFPAGQVTLLALAAGALGWLGCRRPRALALLLGGAAAAALALPLVHLYLVSRWDAHLLAPLSAPVVAALRHLFLLAAQVRAGRFEAMDPRAAWVLLALTALAAALAIIREALARGDAFWSLVAGAALFAFQWLLFWEEAQALLMVYTALGLVLWAVAHAAHRGRRWQQEGRAARHPPHWAAGVAAALLVALGAALLPSGRAPVDPAGLAARLRAAVPALQRLRGGPVTSARVTRFELRTVGFGGDTTALGGPARLDDGVALRLELPEPLDGGPLYLRGSVHTQYTGHGWLPPAGDPSRRAGPDAVLPSALAAAVPATRLQARVIPEGLETETLFHLLEPLGVEEVRSFRADRDANLLAAMPRRRGQAYTVQARVGRTSAAQIRALSQPEALASPDRVPEELQPYLHLPYRDADVARVARQVTRARAHPLDKALALESYLRGPGFRYSLQVPPPPPQGDFVSHFLATRTGYCTYFATAMAVMLREVGIPARWVQGFVVLPGNRSQVEVRNSQAHAWVEAYFPGYGWVTFDPTPRPDIPPPDRSFTVPAEQPAPAGETGIEEPEARRGLEPEREAEEQPPAAAPAPGPRRAPAWAAAAGLALALLLAAAYSFRRLRLPVARHDDAVAVQQLWSHAGRLLAQFGYPRRPTETAREYAAALARAWPELGALAGPAAEAYEAARYAPPGTPLPPGSRAAAARLLRRARALLRRRHGPLAYLWRRLTAPLAGGLAPGQQKKRQPGARMRS